MEKLLNFLAELKQRKIYHELTCVRQEAIMVCVDVPGEKWEVEFFADGNVEIEIFRSNGVIEDEQSIERLFVKFSD